MKEASPQQKTLWFIDSDDDIIGKFHEIASQAKETLEVVASADGLTLFFNSAPNLLDQMQNIGVDVRMFSPLCRARTSSLMNGQDPGTAPRIVMGA